MFHFNTDSGAVEDHENLSGMSTEEKKNLLKGINQSKEEFSSEVKWLLDINVLYLPITFL